MCRRSSSESRSRRVDDAMISVGFEASRINDEVE